LCTSNEKKEQCIDILGPLHYTYGEYGFCVPVGYSASKNETEKVCNDTKNCKWVNNVGCLYLFEPIERDHSASDFVKMLDPQMVQETYRVYKILTKNNSTFSIENIFKGWRQVTIPRKHHY
jgi:hypothetical protein